MPAPFNEKAPPCIECGEPACQVDSSLIYPDRRDLHGRTMYLCHPCEAYVGCHPGTDRALGYPAGKETRGARMYVHKVLDPLWREQIVERKGRARGNVYLYLANRMGLHPDHCHTAMFTIEQCRHAYRILKNANYPDIALWRAAR
jgi:hypothetical protein